MNYRWEHEWDVSNEELFPERIQHLSADERYRLANHAIHNPSSHIGLAQYSYGDIDSYNARKRNENYKKEIEEYYEMFKTHEKWFNDHFNEYGMSDVVGDDLTEAYELFTHAVSNKITPQLQDKLRTQRDVNKILRQAEEKYELMFHAKAQLGDYLQSYQIEGVSGAGLRKGLRRHGNTIIYS